MLHPDYFEGFDINFNDFKKLKVLKIETQEKSLFLTNLFVKPSYQLQSLSVKTCVSNFMNKMEFFTTQRSLTTFEIALCGEYDGEMEQPMFNDILRNVFMFNSTNLQRVTISTKNMCEYDCKSFEFLEDIHCATVKSVKYIKGQRDTSMLQEALVTIFPTAVFSENCGT